MNLGALKSGNYRTYVIGGVFGLIAIWMQRVTVGWLAWEMTDSASFVGAIAFLLFAPTIVLSPIFGVWVDRWPVKRTALILQGINGGLSAVLWTIVALGWASPVLLAVMTLLIGTVIAAHHPVRMAFGPRLVKRELVGSVVTIGAINFNIARMVGPAIGGALIAWVGVAHTLLIQTLLFVPYLASLMMVTLRPRRESGSAQEPFFAALAAGVRHVWHATPVREAMLLGGVLALVARGALEVLPPLADGVFGRGADGLGVIMSATGVGSVLGGFSQAVLPPQRPGRLPLHTRLAIVFGLAMVAVLGLTPSWEGALAVAASMSFVTTVSAICTQTAVQLDVEDDMRGRVMSLWAVVAAGGAALGAGAMGVLADWLGYQTALVWTGSLAALAVSAYLLMARFEA